MRKQYARRLLTLLLGMVVSSVGIVFMLRANIGLEPWSALQWGLEHTTGMSFGFASVIVGVVAIGLAVLFGESFGIGTIGNIVLCGIFIDVLVAINIVPQMQTLPSGIAMLLVGMELLTLGTWMYMRAGLGTGPRDALMVALARKTGKSVGLCRSVLELLCILTGGLMGAKIGVGTVITAIGVGALFNANFHALHFRAAEIHHENVAETVEKFKNRNYKD